MLTQVRSLRDLDLGAIPRQHPDRNLQSPTRWVHDTDRSISPLRSAKDLQSSAMKRVKGVEDLNILIIRAQGIVGVGAGPSAVDPITTALLSAGEGFEPRLPWQVCGRAEARLSPEEARILWRMPSAGGRDRLRKVSADVVSRRLGGICEAHLRRFPTRSALSGPIHAPGRNLQPPARRSY